LAEDQASPKSDRKGKKRWSGGAPHALAFACASAKTSPKFAFGLLQSNNTTASTLVAQ